ncbi:tripartite tricarboxylate transporter substrate binding protein [Polaromonas sp. P1-6]|nr:tripartite tricarboxylate transporter substrate binding protein [Polaromonas sp. P1-6]
MTKRALAPASTDGGNQSAARTAQTPLSLLNRRQVLLSTAAAAAGIHGTVHGQTSTAWIKDRPLRLVVAFSAGSSADMFARTLSNELSTLLGTTVVVENKPGAGGSLATATIASGPPDGHSILIQSSAHSVNPSIYQKLPYDTAKDLSGVAALGWQPYVLVSAPSKKYTSVKNLVERTKANPNQTNYASGGLGSSTHLNGALFVWATGVDTLHIPAKGTSEALLETMTGRVDWYFSPLSVAVPRIKEGSLQALALGSKDRSPALPNTPSMTEAGFPDAAFSGWTGAFVSSKTPRDRVEQLHAAFTQVLAMPAVKAKLETFGVTPMNISTAQFDSFIVEDIRANAKLVKLAQIKPGQ